MPALMMRPSSSVFEICTGLPACMSLAQVKEQPTAVSGGTCTEVVSKRASLEPGTVSLAGS